MTRNVSSIGKESPEHHHTSFIHFFIPYIAYILQTMIVEVTVSLKVFFPCWVKREELVWGSLEDEDSVCIFMISQLDSP